ncbi:DNA repair protein RadC [Ruficoccus sp. ZRK36]|uniref:JAB domain-containing protein n=1 Tax=Ruficoccus sp. ZRK36 TaxID=2866311 RepID=UPI001C72D341|nr:DNA repair protein RadC [Ruficoccus sp. ZRK36]QYY36139.1 DNA repair protein RadC [Ruficoccus sp. ZRK36]
MKPATPGEGHRARLRQRFLKSGFDGFADHEIVEVLLTLCIPRRDVKAPAKALLQRFGSVRGILDASPEQLREIAGIGEVAPVALRIIRESAGLYLRQRAEARSLLDGVDELIDFWRARLGGLRHEVFEVAYLDKRYQLLPDGVQRLEEGVPDRTTVYPRKVMQAALARHAVFIVVAHNHPSGQLKASSEDLHLTRCLISAANAVGLTLLDHLIVTPDDALSFLDQGLLQKC